jgi:hypothetical protein
MGVGHAIDNPTALRACIFEKLLIIAAGWKHLKRPSKIMDLQARNLNVLALYRCGEVTQI